MVPLLEIYERVVSNIYEFDNDGLVNSFSDFKDLRT